MARSFSEARRTNVVTALSSLKVYSLTYFPHYLHPNNTLFLNGPEYDEEGELFSPSVGVQSTYPVKLDLHTDINSLVEKNFVTKLVQQKTDYLNDVVRCTSNYKRSRSKASKNHVYSMHLNNLMELTAKDPDPYFFGSYNWYFTGGTLETASIYDVDFLFYAAGPKKNIFNSSMVVPNRNRLQLQHLDSTIFRNYKIK